MITESLTLEKRGVTYEKIWARSHFSLLNGPGNGMEIADLN